MAFLAKLLILKNEETIFSHPGNIMQIAWEGKSDWQYISESKLSAKTTEQCLWSAKQKNWLYGNVI